MSRLKEYFKLGEVFNYLVRLFKKPDPRYPNNFNLRMMHGINKISIMMFLVCLLIIFMRKCVL
jgi:hypothetical protein